MNKIGQGTKLVARGICNEHIVEELKIGPSGWSLLES